MPDRRNSKSTPSRRGRGAPPDGPVLRLRREDEPARAEDAALQTYKFPGPSPARGGGRRLVAARVAESPLEETFAGSPCAVLNGGEDPDCLGRIVSSRQLVKEIESTLDRMQSRLDRFRMDLGDAFRFPTEPGDRDLPPAA